MKKTLIIIFSTALITSFLFSCGGSDSYDNYYSYHSMEEVEQVIDLTHSVYPSITSVEILGYSKENRPIKSLILSDNPSSLEMEPRIRISGAIHGSEKITTEILLAFIDYLASGYATDPEIKSLIDSRYIVIIPVINPDGYARNIRYNSNNVDLNRNFSREWSSSESHPGTSFFSEPESISVRDYSLEKRFTTSITYHSGSVIVNMPFDYGEKSSGITSIVTPVENSLVSEMALTYTRAADSRFLSNPELHSAVKDSEGIITGGGWYFAYGTMQDWSYLDAGCLDYTIEISKNNPSDPAGIRKIYDYNRASLLAFIKKSGYGIYGRITDGINALPGVEVSLSGGDLVITTDSEGYYHRLLMPGFYTLTYSLPGYLSQTTNVTLTTGKTAEEKNIILIAE